AARDRVARRRPLRAASPVGGTSSQTPCGTAAGRYRDGGGGRRCGRRAGRYRAENPAGRLRMLVRRQRREVFETMRAAAARLRLGSRCVAQPRGCRFASAAPCGQTSTAWRPLYMPQTVQAACGSFGDLQFGQATVTTAVAFQLARRDRVLLRDILRLGTATAGYSLKSFASDTVPGSADALVEPFWPASAGPSLLR